MSVDLKHEKRAVASLAFLYMMRMFGLFMVLPVLALYAPGYQGFTPFLMGVAMGIYGISQGVLQIPMGFLSDRIGRRPVVVSGLLLFAAGSIVAALSTSIYGLIFGRFLQGCGAVSSALMALVSDLTSEQNRTRAMATVGASIGLSFMLAMIAGPTLSSVFGLSGLFWVTFVLATGGMLVMWKLVPVPVAQQAGQRVGHGDTLPSALLLKTVLRDGNLLRLDLGVFMVHACLMACFTVVPTLLEQQLELPRKSHWEVYLPILVGSFIAMLPLMIIGERKRQIKKVFLLAIGLLVLAFAVLSAFHQSNSGLLVGLSVFFFAFNLLEAQMPSLVSKLSHAGQRGTAMGVFSACQSLGVAAGGFCGGYLRQFNNPGLLFVVLMAMTAVWWMLSLSMSEPRYLTNLMLPVFGDADQLCAQLMQIPGVEEAMVVKEEAMAYLKVNELALDKQALENMRAAG
ncbi:MAG TPA: MFS transporter [Pseudomonadales bacterium]|nr:MFS transporter [Pseudomonadales bacterium]